MGGRDALRGWTARYLPALLLVIVACTQIHLASVRELLTPARGAGFGLFSTVDKLADRHLRIYWTDPSGDALASLPADPAIRRHIRMAASMPSEARLRALAALAVRTPEQALRTTLRVEVWKRAFDQDRLEARRVKIRELRVERP